MSEIRISIIGSGSFLAKELINAVKEKCSLTLYGRTNLFAGNIVFTEFYYPEKNIDLPALLQSDIIVYCASAGVQSGIKIEEEVIYHVNAYLPITIVNYLSKQGYKGKFVSFGSYFELGSSDEIHFHSEQELIKADRAIPSHYSNSKRLLTKFFANKFYSISWYHLVLPTIYGPGEQANRLIPYLISALRNNEKIRLTSGKQVRQYVHIRDIVEFIMQHICFDHKLPPGIYNLSAPDYCRVKDVISSIFSIMDKDDKNVEIIQKQDESMAVLLLSNKTVEELTGWRPNISITEGLKTYL